MSKVESGDGKYDVFLSFRGLDTRQGFTDTLYNMLLSAGIRVFRDDDEMRAGDRLDNTILQAVRDSKICVPIFSKHYGTSKWCLKELAEMVKWEKATVPVLFDVEPDDVKLGTALYRDQLEVHEKNGQQEVNLWREALKKVGATKLTKLGQKGHYEFSKELVKDISGRLTRIKQQHLTDHLLGLDDEVELAMKLINQAEDSEVLLGIHGIGGVGKTTLAKIIFNKLSPSFDDTAFLENIRESSRNGIEHLQKVLLCDLSDRLKDAVGVLSSTELMKTNFTNKKVLIVLDDIVKKNQIENLVGKSSCFGAGSRIIVTTRDKRVLNIEQLESSKRVIRRMEIWGLKPPQDLQLFSRHAFGSDSPPQQYRHLSKEIVSTVQGLPLALEVVGSSLRGNFNTDTCKSTIDRLKVTPYPEVKKSLKTSFDALEDREQLIFLDVACFFIPNSNTSDQQLMSSYLKEHYLQLELDTLTSMSLIGESNNALKMHNQIRDLGREIATSTSSKNTKNCRLWVHEDAVKMLKSKRDNENIITLRLDQPCSNGDLTGDEFVDLRNLRLLSLKEPNFPKGFKGSLPMLTYLSMHGCPDTLSTHNLDSSRLLVLDLSYSKIDSKWKGWRHFQTNSLKVLDLSHCLELTSTPDLSKMERLEKLVVEGCSNLKKIKASKDNLKSLRHVNLKGCTSLDATLPKELFSSGNLESLSLHGCTQINQLPDAIKRSKSSLLTLDLSRTSIKQIPEFLGEFKKLRDLSLEGLEIDRIPSWVIHKLVSLVNLDCSFCADLKELPDGIMTSLERLLLVGCSSLKKLPEIVLQGSKPSLLVTLDLSQSGITELTDSVGKLTRLEALLLDECKDITKLPDSVGDLESLKLFSANSSALTRLPATIGKWKNLERLEMAFSDLKKLPKEIGDVFALRSLILSGTRIRQLPSTLSQLSRLTTLELIDCDNLRELTDLPASLTKLHLKSQRLKKVPDLTNLGNLTDLKLIDGSSLKRWTRVESSSLQSITKLSKLTKLELHLSNLTNLPSELKALSELESVVIECPTFKYFPELPSSVSELSLLSISSSVMVQHLSALTNLKVLRIQGFTDLSSLHLPTNIESLWLCDCPSLPNDFLSNAELKKLVELEIVRCSKVVEISGLESAELLERLSIQSCELLENIGNLSGARHLINLKVIDCPKARTIQGLNELSLKSTDFSGSDFLKAMKMSEVSVALSAIANPLNLKLSMPVSGYLKSKLNEQQELYEKAQKVLNISDKVSLQLPGTKLLVDAFVTHKDQLHIITQSISTRLAKKIFGNFRRNSDVNQITRTALRNDCYLTWLERSEEHEDLASEKEWSEYDESEDDDDINEVQKYPNASSLLVSPGRNFLIQNDGSQVRIDSLGPVKLNLYFAASWSVQCLMLTIMMATEYSSRDKKTATDVVVFVSMDEDEESFKRHFSMMPWLAIPFSDAEKRNSLVELFKVKKVPQLVIIDEDGNVTFDKCEGPREICPCPPERLKELKEQKEAAQRDQSLRSILVHGSGDFVISLSQGEIVPIDKLEGKTICLSFPSFSDNDNDIDESLSQVYKTLKANGENFETVMIIPGRYDEDTVWDNLLGSSDGFALLVHPNVYGQLIDYFEISSLPALVMIGTDGKTVLPSAVEAVTKYGAEAYPFTPEKLKEFEMQVWFFKMASYEHKMDFIL